MTNLNKVYVTDRDIKNMLYHLDLILDPENEIFEQYSEKEQNFILAVNDAFNFHYELSENERRHLAVLVEQIMRRNPMMVLGYMTRGNNPLDGLSDDEYQKELTKITGYLNHLQRKRERKALALKSKQTQDFTYQSHFIDKRGNLIKKDRQHKDSNETKFAEAKTKKGRKKKSRSIKKKVKKQSM